MQVYRGLEQIKDKLAASVLTMGNFDGVHRGHKTILNRVRERAAESALESVLLTFEPHPVQVLFPERRLKRLFPLRDLESQVEKAGLQTLVIEPFTRALAAYSAGHFLDEKVLQGLHPKEIIVGHDFSFGANRGGTIDFLRTWCQSHKIKLGVQEPVEIRGERVSSRRIRELVSSGDMELAASFLGRHFYLEGQVETGAGRGRVLGVPTVNMRLSEYVVPRPGVYVTNTVVGFDTFRSVSNLGTSPTFETDGEMKLETHLLDFSRDLYGQTIEVHFLKFLREEKKFASVDALAKQIWADIASARDHMEDEI